MQRQRLERDSVTVYCILIFCKAVRRRAEQPLLFMMKNSECISVYDCLQTLVVKHADTKYNSAFFHNSCFCICVFYHQELAVRHMPRTVPAPAAVFIIGFCVSSCLRIYQLGIKQK